MQGFPSSQPLEQLTAPVPVPPPVPPPGGLAGVLPGASCTDGPVGSAVLSRLHIGRKTLIRRRNRLRVRLADAAGRAAGKAYLRSVNKMPGDADSPGWREKF